MAMRDGQFISDDIPVLEELIREREQLTAEFESQMGEPIEQTNDMRSMIAGIEAPQAQVPEQYRPGVLGALGAALQGTPGALQRMGHNVQFSAQQANVTRRENARTRSFVDQQKNSLKFRTAEMERSIKEGRELRAQQAREAESAAKLELGARKSDDAKFNIQMDEQRKAEALASRERAQIRQDGWRAEWVGAKMDKALLSLEGIAPLDESGILLRGYEGFFKSGGDGVYELVDKDGLTDFVSKEMSGWAHTMGPEAFSFMMGSDGTDPKELLAQRFGGDATETELPPPEDRQYIKDFNEIWAKGEAQVLSNQKARAEQYLGDMTDAEFQKNVAPFMDKNGNVFGVWDDTEVTKWWRRRNDAIVPGSGVDDVGPLLVDQGRAVISRNSHPTLESMGDPDYMLPGDSRDSEFIESNGRQFYARFGTPADQEIRDALPQNADAYRTQQIYGGEKRVLDAIDRANTELAGRMAAFDIGSITSNVAFQGAVDEEFENPEPVTGVADVADPSPNLNTTERILPAAARTPIVEDQGGAARYTGLNPKQQKNFISKGTGSVKRQVWSKDMQKKWATKGVLPLTGSQIRNIRGVVGRYQLTEKDLVDVGIPAEVVSALLERLQR